MPPDATGISLQDITLVRGASPVFEGLSLHLREPRIGLIGDNGAGKSSLFRLACGLERPRAGRVLVDGEAPGEGAGAGRRIGMMFQSPDEQIIFPTVDEELALGLTAQGLARREAQARAREWLAGRGLGHWAGRAISSLSQGQRQHVCWLALLIAAPRVLLLDEPYASLDLPGQALLREEIARAPQQVLVSTHLLDHVRRFERVIWLDRGRVRGDGPGAQVCADYEADIARRAREHVLSFDLSAATASD
ncbi:energy-coupling factor ABC transporter ATP-binding protein [Ramlibacter sp. MAHUQ-53]|uniref:energy-coupling factor ABC transporter ATP-binding protein n=1 Tax=unclassified Ramlibacter TaxID=2617605 RepID=UPI0036449581